MRWWINTIIVIVLAIIIIVVTPIGLYIGMAIVKSQLPGKLSYSSIRGSLFAPITFVDLHYQSPDATVDAKKLTIHLSPWAILGSHLLFKQLTGHDINIDITPQPTPNDTQPNAPLTLPWDFSFRKAEFNNIHVALNHDDLATIKDLKLHGILSEDDINFGLATETSAPYAVKSSLKLTGNLQNYKIKFDCESEHQQSTWQGDGTPRGLSLRLTQGTLLKGQAISNFQLSWAPYLNWHVYLRATNMDVAQLNSSLPKKVSVNLIADGDNQKTTINLKHAQFPMYNEQVTASAHVQLVGDTIPNISVQVKTRDASLSINGRRTAQWQLAWKIDVPQLENFITTGAKGNIYAEGKVTGDLKNPAITADLKLKNLQAANLSVKALNGDLSYNTHGNQYLQANLNAQAISYYTAVFNHIKINLDGTPTNHDLNAEFVTDDAQTQIALVGDYQAQQWRGTLNKFTINSKNSGIWQLDKPTALRISKNAVIINPACWHSAQGNLCLQGNWQQTQPWRLTVNGNNIAIGFINQLLPQSVNINGRANLSAQASGNGAELQRLSLTTKLLPGKINFEDNQFQQHTQNYQGANLNVNYQQPRLSAQFTFNLDRNDYLKAQLSLPQLNLNQTSFNWRQPVAGNLQAQFTQLKTLEPLMGGNATLEGLLKANANFNGTLEDPKINGTINLVNGKVSLQRTGVTLNNISMNVTADKRQLLYKLLAYSNKQPITLEGKTHFDKGHVISDMTLSANDVLVYNTPDYIIYASPNLKLKQDNYNVDVTGSVLIPRATIQPRSFDETVTLPTEDIIYIGDAKEQNPWHLSARIQLVMGPNIRVDSKGVTGKLAGEITIIKAPDRVPIATGQISLHHGIFDAYGRKLTIARGNLIFTKSPLKNPNLDIRATRSFNSTPGFGGGGQSLGAQNIIVGVQIAGTLRRPHTSLFSNQSALSQSDILSYLILGHAANVGSTGNVSMLLAAANSLKLGTNQGTGKDIMQEIQQGLGFTELGVESASNIDATGTNLGYQSSFVVGRYLSPRLYLRYSIGLAYAVNVLQLRYILSKHWMIQTDSSTLGNGADILYTFERK